MTNSQQYSARLRLREQTLAACDRLNARIGSMRLLLMAAFLSTALSRGLYHRPSAAWLLLPGALFIGLLAYHRRVRQAHGRATRATAYYRAGLSRLHGDPQFGGRTGDRFNDEHHLYAADLDLFGAHGLYARLCRARTPMGESALARWLLNPADLSTIHARQTSIRELRDNLDLREDLAILGDVDDIALDPGALARWIDGPDELAAAWLRPAAAGLCSLAVAAAAVWAIWGYVFPLLAVLTLEAVLNQAMRRRVHRCVSAVEHAYEDLKLLSTLLRRLEGETFESPMLKDLRHGLFSHSSTASATLAKLATVVNFVEARRNPFLAPLLLPLLYTIHSALAAERWRRRHGRVVGAWLDTLGEIESLQSLAGYSFEHPEDPFPEFVNGPAAFRAIGVGHPLISAATRVRNDLELAGGTRVFLVSGSNMSGKSTLLRCIGINVVLAMAGAPVCARQLKLTPLQVGASIRVNDSLHAGSSRFYAEITRLRQLFEPAALPLLFLLDELLQGTNSADRRIGALGVIRALIRSGAIGLVSTHDLTLTDGSDLGPGALRNVHFQDELDGGTLKFDFTLRDGVVTKSNGLELMRAIGLEV